MIYRADKGYRGKVFLNGEEINDVVLCSDVEGCALQHQRDTNGNFLLNEKRDGVKTKRVYGVIKFIPDGENK